MHGASKELQIMAKKLQSGEMDYARPVSLITMALPATIEQLITAFMALPVLAARRQNAMWCTY